MASRTDVCFFDRLQRLGHQYVPWYTSKLRYVLCGGTWHIILLHPTPSLSPRMPLMMCAIFAIYITKSILIHLRPTFNNMIEMKVHL